MNTPLTPTVRSSQVEVAQPWMIHAGDTLGFANSQEECVVGYHFEAVDLLYSPRVMTYEPGDWLIFDELAFPYNFAFAALFRPGACA